MSFIQFCGPQRLGCQLGEMSCLFVDEGYKIRLRRSKTVDLQQSRACALDGRQRRLESVCQSVKNTGAELLTPFRCFRVAFGCKGMRSLQRHRRKGSDSIDRAWVEWTFLRRRSDVKRAHRPG